MLENKFSIKLFCFITLISFYDSSSYFSCLNVINLTIMTRTNRSTQWMIPLTANELISNMIKTLRIFNKIVTIISNDIEIINHFSQASLDLKAKNMLPVHYLSIKTFKNKIIGKTSILQKDITIEYMWRVFSWL